MSGPADWFPIGAQWAGTGGKEHAGDEAGTRGYAIRDAARPDHGPGRGHQLGNGHPIRRRRR